MLCGDPGTGYSDHYRWGSPLLILRDKQRPRVRILAVAKISFLLFVLCVFAVFDALVSSFFYLF